MMIVCDIPIGKDDTGGPLHGFCIGNGYTGEKLAEILAESCKNSSKIIDFS